MQRLRMHTLKVYGIWMAAKPSFQPHHPLSALKRKFALLKTASIRTTPLLDAAHMGFTPSQILEVIQSLTADDFVKTAPANNPPQPGCWHDSYVKNVGGVSIYLKFAGTSVDDVRLTSFKGNSR